MKKKIYFMMMLVIMSSHVAFGQVSPVKRVIPNHNYTVNELREFINGNDPILPSWKYTLVTLVQDGLLKCGEDLFFLKNQPIDDAVDFILDNSVLVRIDLQSNFKNSGRTRDHKMKFVIDPRTIDNVLFLQFRYGSCQKDIIKMNCFNLPDLPERKIALRVEKVEDIVPENKNFTVGNNEWTYQPPKMVKEQKVNPSVLMPFNQQQEEEKKRFFQTKFARIGLPIIAGIGAGLVAYNWDNWFGRHPFDEGGPVGAPSYPANGGPGGSPTYGKNFQQPTIGAGIKIGF